jgi:hypothetical protein
MTHIVTFIDALGFACSVALIVYIMIFVINLKVYGYRMLSRKQKNELLIELEYAYLESPILSEVALRAKTNLRAHSIMGNRWTGYFIMCYDTGIVSHPYYYRFIPPFTRLALKIWIIHSLLSSQKKLNTKYDRI